VVPPLVLRRLGLPLLIALELALLPLLLVAAVVGAVAVVVDRRARVLRLALMGSSYIVIELYLLARLFVVWLARPVKGRAWSDAANLALVASGLGHILGAARRTVGLRVVLHEHPAAAPPAPGGDPVLVLARHGGIGDSFALMWLLAARLGRRPRVVLKSLLLWEPLLDVALTRLGACFLPARARRRGEATAMVAATASSLEPGDALLLFPEGGNWTPRRRLQAMARLWSAGKPQSLRAAALMEHVLPPRAGGVLACLDARPDLDVMVMAHAGLDRLVKPGEVWRALPFAADMEVRWWPVTPPPESADRAAWLTAEWAVVDQWIDGRRPAPGPGISGMDR
jgi:1-acyl-sn-glycerol-3-phosphate acyltransferase